MPDGTQSLHKDDPARTILRDYEMRFRLMEEHLTLGMFQISPDDNGRILSTNRIMRCILGYDDPADLIGKDLRDILLKPADYDTFNESIMRDGWVTGMEIHLKRKDNSATWVSLQAWKLMAPQSSGMIVECFIEDVTEHRVFEQESQYHESELNRFAVALAQANKKLNLLSNITRHDILNKLTGLQGYLELMKTDFPDPRVQEYLKTQESIIQTLTLQVRFTKDYQSIGVESPRWFGVREIITTATGALPLTTISLTIDTANISIYADPMLEKVFYNLVENALRHGGNVTRIRFSTVISDVEARIICEDDGCGVPEKFKEDIFLRKYFKNTGFGLFLSREILDITGFSIRETGVPGNGARFEITIPQGYFRIGDDSQ
jgi:PAS domain S-box-containing protein